MSNGFSRASRSLSESDGSWTYLHLTRELKKARNMNVTKILIVVGVRPHRVVINKLNSNIIVTEFEVQPCYLIHFQAIAHGLNNTITVLQQLWL